jgi:uncharacterized RDD family membrane protein YckC
MKLNLNLPDEPTFKGAPPFWKRAAAFAIDILIIDFIIGMPFRGIFESLMPSSEFQQSFQFLTQNQSIAAILSLVMILYGLLALMYFTLLEYKIGQTLGKMFMQIKVENTSNTRNFLSFIVRNMYLLMFFPFVLLWIIDPVFMLFTKEKRRLSEILSKTRTIQIYSLR